MPADVLLLAQASIPGLDPSIPSAGAGSAVGWGAGIVTVVIVVLQWVQKSGERNETNLKDQMKVDREDFNRRVDGIREDMATLKADHASQISTMKSEHAATIAKLEAQIAELRAEVAKRNDLVSTLTGAAVENKATILHLREDKEKLELEKLRLEAEVDALLVASMMQPRYGPRSRK